MINAYDAAKNRLYFESSTSMDVRYYAALKNIVCKQDYLLNVGECEDVGHKSLVFCTGNVGLNWVPVTERRMINDDFYLASREFTNE